MLAETVDLGFLSYPEVTGDRTGHVYGQGLTDKRPKDDVEGEKENIKVGLFVAGIVGRRGRDEAREKEERSKGVRNAGGSKWS